MRIVNLILLLGMLGNPAYAELFSLSPSTMAKKDLALRNWVKWQTGCTHPDLSKSKKNGTASINVFLNPDGTTKKVEIESSNGTPEENKIITDTFNKCTFIAIPDENQTFSPYFYKTLIYNWPKGNQKPAIGLQKCIFIISYPAHARRNKGIQGKVVWGVRPIDNMKFEKKLFVDSKTGFFESRTEKEIDKCLNNTDIANSIRENFKNGEWDKIEFEFTLNQ